MALILVNSSWVWVDISSISSKSTLPIFFLLALEFELRPSLLVGRHSTAWATPAALFYDGVLEIGSLELFAWDWLWTAILLISASWVVRITGMSHWPLAKLHLKCNLTQQKEKCWRYHNTQFQNILQSHSNKNSMVLAQKQIWRPVKQNRGPGYESTQLCPPYFWQRCQKRMMANRQPLQQILLRKVIICLQKTETRSMPVTLY
jgi:hypothetical protein